MGKKRQFTFRITWHIKTHGQLAVPKLAPPEPPNPGGLAQKGGPVNSQYVVLFTQRMIKVP